MSISQKNNSRKLKLTLIFVLGIIILSPYINTSVATPSAGVEIKEGEKYNWVLKLNISNLIELIRDTGQGSIPSELVALDLQGDSGLLTVEINLEILHGPDNFIVDSFFDVSTSLFEGKLGIAPDFNISQIPIFYPLNFTNQLSRVPANYSILKGDTSNYFSIPIGFFLIVATDLNWTNAAMKLQTRIQQYYMRTSSVESQDSGLKITIPADTIISATELSLNYNSKGILEYAKGNHGGPILFTIEYIGAGTTGSIAFELPFLLGVFIIALVTLMVRKRKKFSLYS